MANDKLIQLGGRGDAAPAAGQLVQPAGIPMQAIFFPHGGVIARCQRQLSPLELVTPANADMIDLPVGSLVLCADPGTAARVMGPLGVREDAGGL